MTDEVGRTDPTASTADGAGAGAGAGGGQEKPAVLIIGGLGASYLVVHIQAPIHPIIGSPRPC
jgi:hypothetical protein